VHVLIAGAKADGRFVEPPAGRRIEVAKVIVPETRGVEVAPVESEHRFALVIDREQFVVWKILGNAVHRFLQIGF
jgi:hypothetical protein